jgi:very-short-patch-repair endonuclease
MRKARFKYIENNLGIVYPIIGKNEKKILDKLEIDLGYIIIRQYKVSCFHLDGYIPEINLAIEVDEEYHKKQKDKDIAREEFIKQKLGCQFLRIKEYE